MQKSQTHINQYDAMAKLAIIGDSSVGKTNILLRYVNADANMSHIATIGIDFKVKSVTIDDFKLKLQIWDTAGQQRFRNITGTVYQGAQAILLVYSVADRKSFNNITKWIQQVKNNAPQNIVIALAGNKIDLAEERVISYEQGQKIAKSLGNCIFFQTSAKENIGITQILDKICRKIKDKLVLTSKRYIINKNTSPRKQQKQKPQQRQRTVSKISKQEKVEKQQTLKLKSTQTKQNKKKKCC